jgi:hypothetical protein
MNFFQKMFGKKKDPLDGIRNIMDDQSIELDTSSGSGSDKADKDYKHNHCFVFFGLNEEGFEAIQAEFENFDGPDHLSVLRSQAGVFITDLCNGGKGSENVKEHSQADEVESEPEHKELYQYVANRVKLRGMVERSLEKYIPHISEELITDENRKIGSDFLKFIEKNKHYLVENITYGYKKWIDSDYFETEDLIGAMVVFFKSSKEFDQEDQISENQDGMNLPVTTRDGFIRSCMYALEDVINVKHDRDPENEDGEIEYDESHPAGAGYKKDDINRYGSNTEIMKYGAFKKGVPCGIAYFDQEGRLWEIYEVGKAIKLFREGLDEIERTVSH